jgi:glycosidase
MNLIRQKNAALRTGSCETIMADDDKGVFAYRRKLGANEVVVGINNSDKQQTVELLHGWPTGTKIKRPLQGKTSNGKVKESALKLALEPRTGEIVIKEK